MRTQSQVLKHHLSRSQAVTCSSHIHLQGMKSRNKTHRDWHYGYPQHGMLHQKDSQDRLHLSHMELPWQCCKMDAHFHNPPSAILLNHSHIAFSASFKWQTSAKDLKHSRPTSNSQMSSPVMLAKIRNSSSNEPEEPKHSEQEKSIFFPWGDPLWGEGSGESCGS